VMVTTARKMDVPRAATKQVSTRQGAGFLVKIHKGGVARYADQLVGGSRPLTVDASQPMWEASSGGK